MTELLLASYESTVLSWGALALLLLIQITVVDIVSLRARHVPGTPVEANHDNLLFRVSRTVANTNESIAAYLVLVLFCIFSGADAAYTGYLSWTYVLGRAAYAVCYYLNLQLPRSACFGVTLLAMVGLLVIGAAPHV